MRTLAKNKVPMKYALYEGQEPIYQLDENGEPIAPDSVSAVQLIANGKTGYMAIVKNTTAPTDEWKAGGVPITMMMNMERRNGEMKPVIRKALVELDGAPFKKFAEKRDEWAKETCYVYPGPIQYWGPASVCDRTTRTLSLEQLGK